jgi:hypothetical protein
LLAISDDGANYFRSVSFYFFPNACDDGANLCRCLTLAWQTRFRVDSINRSVFGFYFIFYSNTICSFVQEELDHFYRVLAIKTDMLFRAYPEHKPFAVSEEDKAVQERLKEFANECIDLLDDALRRIPAEKRRPLFSVKFAFAVLFLLL